MKIVYKTLLTIFCIYIYAQLYKVEIRVPSCQHPVHFTATSKRPRKSVDQLVSLPNALIKQGIGYFNVPRYHWIRWERQLGLCPWIFSNVLGFPVPIVPSTNPMKTPLEAEERCRTHFRNFSLVDHGRPCLAIHGDDCGRVWDFWVNDVWTWFRQQTCGYFCGNVRLY